MAQQLDTISGTSQFVAKNLSVSCPNSGNTELLKLNVVGTTRLFVQIAVATQALDAFVIAGKAHPGAASVTLFSAAADFTTPGGIIVDASGDITTTAAAGTAWFFMNTYSLYEITISASGAADSASVSIWANGQ
jgi:hypothetical protein